MWIAVAISKNKILLRTVKRPITNVKNSSNISDMNCAFRQLKIKWQNRNHYWLIRTAYAICVIFLFCQCFILDCTSNCFVAYLQSNIWLFFIPSPLQQQQQRKAALEFRKLAHRVKTAIFW